MNNIGILGIFVKTNIQLKVDLRECKQIISERFRFKFYPIFLDRELNSINVEESDQNQAG